MHDQATRFKPMVLALLLAIGCSAALAMERPPKDMDDKGACEEEKRGAISESGKHLKTSPKEVEKYWTPERMRKAKPMEHNVVIKKKDKSPCKK